jgi:uncharacterized membrane protein SirB2
MIKESIIMICMIPSVIAIAYIDYLVLSEWFKCQSCGYKETRWYAWIVPSFFEILLFMTGISIGFLMK